MTPPNGPTDADLPKAADLARLVDDATKNAELRDPDENASVVDRWVNRVAEIGGIAVLATILVLVFCNAFSRYFFGVVAVWVDEVVISLMPWLGMLGLFLSVRRRQVIRIDYFVDNAPPAVARALDVFASILSAAILLYLGFASFQYVQLFGSDRSIYLDIPAYWFTSALLIGAVAAAIAYLVEGLRSARGVQRQAP